MSDHAREAAAAIYEYEQRYHDTFNYMVEERRTAEHEKRIRAAIDAATADANRRAAWYGLLARWYRHQAAIYGAAVTGEHMPEVDANGLPTWSAEREAALRAAVGEGRA